LSTDPTESWKFYRERVPAQFNRTWQAQQTSAANDVAAAQQLEGMRTVRATIRVIVRRPGGDEVHDLDVVDGSMLASDSGRAAPFMTLVHDDDSFATIERESGDSVLGFLGALAGLQEDMKLTSLRIQNLSQIDGSLLFELTGKSPLALTAHFGSGAPQHEPRCCLRIDSETYAELRSGALAPQDAFMDGRIQIEGDMQMAMQLALAALSPD
jgi:hypothetical protein